MGKLNSITNDELRITGVAVAVYLHTVETAIYRASYVVANDLKPLKTSVILNVVKNPLKYSRIV